MITIPADSSEPAFDIVAIIEPLSRGAQKILPILLVCITAICYTSRLCTKLSVILVDYVPGYLLY